MAKRKGFTVSMDNSDNEQRKFDIMCDISVNSDGEKKIKSISVSKNGIGAVNTNVANFSPENPDISFNFYNLPMSEHAECVVAVYDFIKQALEEVTQDNV